MGRGAVLPQQFEGSFQMEMREKMGYVMAFVLLLFAFCTRDARGQEVTVTSSVKPIYLGAQGSRFYVGPVLQSDVSITWENGVYVDLWGSTSNTRRMEFDKEYDVTVGYDREFGRFSHHVDLMYIGVQGIDVVNVNLETSMNGLPLTPFLRAEGYSPTQKGGPVKGLILSLGASKGFDIGSKLALGVLGRIKHDSGAFGFNEAWLTQGTVDLTLKATSTTSISVGITLSRPVTRVTDGRTNEAVWEFGISRRFK